ncbi:hypothetical protein [Rhizobium ruizarguesonis]|uniref:hypothetical protein n=1 Tax=Rhizobium ruizarguesonis TaxID=2081791 RepID=UPI00102FAC3B|nr:hypothetical protein [Rhizobium ruizarguesonis]TAZ68241.1 hypothetical protein ELH68_32650 [Rhizobium ruizarguesonis]TAZ92271.1 hypothetical protein ELH64_25720 [Rhizobium ruizarguesonis]
MSDPALRNRALQARRPVGKPAARHGADAECGMRDAERDFPIGRLLDNDYPETTLTRIRLIEAAFS